MKYPVVPFEVMEVAREYTLLQMGLTWADIEVIPADKADQLLLLHKEIKDYEEEQMKKINI